MDLPDSFFFQFRYEFFHVSIQFFLREQILKGKRTAFFNDTQRLPDNFAFIGLGAHFVEDKIADCSVEGSVRKFESGGVAFAEDESVCNMLQTGVLFALLFCVTPFRPQ